MVTPTGVSGHTAWRVPGGRPRSSRRARGERRRARRTELSRPSIPALAHTAGLDTQCTESDLKSAEDRAAVARDVQDGERAGVEGTPPAFIIGREYHGDPDLAAMRKVIDEELKEAR